MRCDSSDATSRAGASPAPTLYDGARYTAARAMIEHTISLPGRGQARPVPLIIGHNAYWTKAATSRAGASPARTLYEGTGPGRGQARAVPYRVRCDVCSLFMEGRRKEAWRRCI